MRGKSRGARAEGRSTSWMSSITLPPSCSMLPWASSGKLWEAPRSFLTGITPSPVGSPRLHGRPRSPSRERRSLSWIPPSRSIDPISTRECPIKVVLIATYELGRQPFGMASAAAWLRRAGALVTCLDLAVEQVREEAVVEADLVAFHVPMHTATRLAVPLAARTRELNPKAHLCFFGLYAPMNEPYLRGLGAGTILGGEFEAGLAALVARLREGAALNPRPGPAISLAKQVFLVPDRSGLPELSRYAYLDQGAGRRRIVGYTEASRGCKHLCRHCPVVPVYGGIFRVVQAEVVLEDVA